MKSLIFTASAISLALVGCSRSENLDPARQDGDKPTVAVTKSEKKAKRSGNRDGGIRLHPTRQYCVDYEMKGQAMSGQTRECSKNYGRNRFEITNTAMSFGGFKQEQHTQTIYVDDKIYTIDLDAGTASVRTNPMYDRIKKALNDRSAKDLNAAFMEGMGYSATGNAKTIAGYECEVYRSSQLGTLCLHKSGVILEQDVMGMSKVATKLDLNTSGESANYTAYKKYPLTEAPDVNSILNKVGKP